MIFVIYIMALAYAACSPMILPFTLCYFLSAWVRLSLIGVQVTDALHTTLTLHCDAPSQGLIK